MRRREWKVVTDAREAAEGDDFPRSNCAHLFKRDEIGLRRIDPFHLYATAD
jgi:hypothetical protein